MREQSFGLSAPLRHCTRLLAGGALLFASASTTPAHARQAGGPALPDAATLLDRHVQATGGEQAHRALTSRKRRGKLAVEMAGHDFVANLEEHYLAPDKSHSSIDGDFFVQVNVCDGKDAWEWRPAHSHGDDDHGQDAGITTLLEGAQKERALEKADFRGALRWRERFAAVETLAVVDVNGAPAYEVRLTTRQDEQYSQFYDRSSGRMVKRTRSSPSHQGDLDMEVFFEAYREFDGVWLPTVVRALVTSPTMGKGTQVWTYTETVHNQKIAPSLFEMPEELRSEAHGHGHGHGEHEAPGDESSR